MLAQLQPVKPVKPDQTISQPANERVLPVDQKLVVTAIQFIQRQVSKNPTEHRGLS
jgi:hypothetical protein